MVRSALLALVVIDRQHIFIQKNDISAVVVGLNACVIDSSLLFHKIETFENKTAGQSF
jgi:hypothetical protein